MQQTANSQRAHIKSYSRSKLHFGLSLWRLSQSFSPAMRAYFLLHAVTKWLIGMEWNFPYIICRWFYIDSLKNFVKKPYGFDFPDKLLTVLYIGTESFLHFSLFRHQNFFLLEYFTKLFFEILWYRPFVDCVRNSLEKTVRVKF
jgi:hypothetical protein